MKNIHSSFLNKAHVFCNGINGKNILEVGCGNGNLIQTLTEIYKPEKGTGIDINCNNKTFSSICEIKKEDIRKTPFSDDTFDIILSEWTFEHVFDFELAINEMYRILKNGGFLFTQFGPIWSAPHGHHLWYYHDSQFYTYNDVILPSFCHLLMQPSEILSFLTDKYDFNPSIIKGIVDYVFNSNDQNRLFFEDYQSIIKSSSFTELFFKGISSDKLEDIYHNKITPDTFKKLNSKYNNHTNFLHNGITFLLTKD